MAIVTRDGELSSSSLTDALKDEARRGRRPHTLFVGSAELYVQAMRILKGVEMFDELRVAMPRVELDEHLADFEWELHEAAEGPR